MPFALAFVREVERYELPAAGANRKERGGAPARMPFHASLHL